MIYIGIDTGTETGVALYDSKQGKLLELLTTTIDRAFDYVRQKIDLYGKSDTIVYFEDARLRKWVGNSGRERLQGAGSIKRDGKIWQTFLENNGIAYCMVAPKNNRTKMKPDYFKLITGYTRRCSEHARDAAMLVVGR